MGLARAASTDCLLLTDLSLDHHGLTLGNHTAFTGIIRVTGCTEGRVGLVNKCCTCNRRLINISIFSFSIAGLYICAGSVKLANVRICSLLHSSCSVRTRFNSVKGLVTCLSVNSECESVRHLYNTLRSVG